MTGSPNSRGSSLPESAQRILEIADDELILGWRNSEWTGIAPFLEEDVAFSSIAQTESGHARAWYELAAIELGTDADSLAFDREPGEYRCAPLVELRLVPDWARTIARHWLYETADAIRIDALQESEDPEVAGLAEKIAREETYHRMHAQMWEERLRDEPRFREAVQDLWPYSLGLLADSQRQLLCERVGLDPVEPAERGEHTDELAPLLEEMTMVRRSVPGAAW
jgi:ring-1,2-phenylacetyl-CoA epoxidase subunit PaaC